MGDTRSRSSTISRLGKLFGGSKDAAVVAPVPSVPAGLTVRTNDIVSQLSQDTGLRPTTSRELLALRGRSSTPVSPIQSPALISPVTSPNASPRPPLRSASGRVGGTTNSKPNGGAGTSNSGTGSANSSPATPPTGVRSQPVSRSSSTMRKPSTTNGTASTTSTTTSPSLVAASGITAPTANTTATTTMGNSGTNGAPHSGTTPAVSRNSSISRNKLTIHSNTSHTNLNSLPAASGPNCKPRFRILDSGNHEHNLRSAKRQEKLSNMLKDLLGAKKLRDGAKSEVPNILQGVPVTDTAKPPTLFAGLVNQVKNNTSPYHGQPPGELTATAAQRDSRSFVEKYGRCQEVVGKGSFGVVRVAHKKSDNTDDGIHTSNGSNGNNTGDLAGGTAGPGGEILYAVKEFKRKQNELEQKYNRRLTSEFCISSSLKHRNIIDTLDLLKDAKGDYCEVMEFCSGGDLYTLIIALGKLEYAEADCFFKQLIRGVNYMHDMGVSHRDLKPENLLLTQQGVLKITDFGNGECFKMAWEKEIQLSEGICGSSPYIAPEEFTQKLFDPRCVDIWACGVIYMAMRTGRQLWKLADQKKDEFFEEYLLKRKDATGYDPIELLKRARCRNVIYSILDPKPERRITGKQILNSEWGREIKVCAAGEGHAIEG